jgi:hypothetical protein
MISSRSRGAVAALVLGVAPAACKGSSSSGDKPAAAAGRYGVLRPAIVAAVQAVPADPGALPRCAADLGHVVSLALDEAAQALATKPPGTSASLERAAFQTYAGRSLANLERGDRASYDVDRFEGAQRISLFRATVATAPTLTGCEPPGGAAPGQFDVSRCQLTPGRVQGSSVVFDDKGAPVCATALDIEGPTSTSVASPAEVVKVLSSFTSEALHLLFAAGPSSGARPLVGKPPANRDVFRVSIDGAVVGPP